MLNRTHGKIVCLCSLCLIVQLNVIAQGEENIKDYLIDGILWTNSGDTLKCKILYINQFSFQFNITIADTSGSEIALYSPKDIEGFKYSINDNEIEFNSMLNPIDLGRMFLRVLYRGRYTLYQFLEINHKSPVMAYTASYYIWDGKWITPAITQQKEVESLLSHFSDCPELEYKIKTQEYRLSDIRRIIDEYEACVLTDDYEFFYE